MKKKDDLYLSLWTAVKRLYFWIWFILRMQVLFGLTDPISNTEDDPQNHRIYRCEWMGITFHFRTFDPKIKMFPFRFSLKLLGWLKAIWFALSEKRTGSFAKTGLKLQGQNFCPALKILFIAASLINDIASLIICYFQKNWCNVTNAKTASISWFL